MISAHLLPIPEILKALLALPAILIIPCYVGQTVSYVKFIRKYLYHVDSTSKIIIEWIIGFIFIIYIYTIFYLFGISIQEYTLLILILFIYSAFTNNQTVAFKFANILKCLGDKKIAIPLIGLLFSLYFLLVSPFPLTLDLDMFRHNLLMLNLLEDNYLVGLGSYVPSFHIFFSIISVLYNLDTFSLFWSAIPLAYIIYAIGIYLFSFQLSKNTNVSIMAVAIGVAVTWTKTVALYRIIPQTFLYILIPYYLYILCKNSNQLKNYNSLGALRIISIAILAYMCNYILMPMNYVYDSAYYGIAGRSFVLLIYMLIIFKITQTKLDFIFSLLTISALLIHLPMGIATIFVLAAYILFLYIGQNIMIFAKYLQIIAILSILLIILEISSIFQYSEYIRQSIIFGNAYEFNSIDKFNILKQIYSIPIIITFLIGLFSTIKKSKDISILLTTTIIIFMYFSSIDSIFRILILFTPFCAYLAAIGLKKIVNRRAYGKTASMTIIILLVIMLFTPIITLFTGVTSMGNSEHISSFTYYEYQTGTWIKNNLKDNVVILSDPMTQLILSGISKKRNFGEGSSDINTKKALKQIFISNNPREASHLIQNTYNNLSTGKRDNYFRTFFAPIRESDDEDIIVVISGRTETWVKGSDESSIDFWGTNQFPNEFIDKDIVSKFMDEAYFELVYNYNNDIYIFRLITDKKRYANDYSDRS